jgi:non-ribosomal peptide synthetase component F
MTLEIKPTTWADCAFASAQAGEPPCLHELFEAQADARGQAPALIRGDLVLSYAGLEARSNRLARHLRSLGVGPGSFVGLCLERSELPIIAILAVLKSGGAYVPLDPAYPDDRMRFIVGEAGIEVMLTEQALEARVARLVTGSIVSLDQAAESIAAQS